MNADFILSLLITSSAYLFLALIWKNQNIDEKQRKIKNILTSVILVSVLVLSFFYIINRRERTVDHRIGIENIVNSSVKNSATKIIELQSKISSSKVLDDEVPTRLQISKGQFKSAIYRIDKDTDLTTSYKIFDGKFSKIQHLSIEQFYKIFQALLLLVIMAAAIDYKFKLRRYAFASLAFTSLLSIFLSIRISEGWDEVFINLRHAYMLVNHGIYSINALNMVEGSVDFLPIFCTAILGFLGADLLSTFIIFSLLGNVIVIIFSYLITQKLTGNRTWALLCALIAGIYPNIIYVGATGFSATLFTGWILAASYFILFTPKRLVGLIILSLLTLVRVEGILFAAILMAYVYVIKPLPEIIRTKHWKLAAKRAVIDGMIVLAPFILSLITRYYFFGQAIPNPALFKNAHFDTSFFSSGINYFVNIIAFHDLHLLLALILLLLVGNFFICRKNEKLQLWSENIKKLLALNFVIFLFILPYYANGGDWFPLKWNRYGLPFNIALVLTAMTLIYGVFFLGNFSKKISIFSLLILCFSLSINYIKSSQTRSDNYFSDLGFPSMNRWGRIDNLSSLGQFLKNTTPQDAVIASPEEATVMYFSQREMLGLLGVSNPEMTKMPLQPIAPGDAVHRKRGHLSVYNHRPDVIALYEPVIDDKFILEKSISDILKKDFFAKDKCDIAYYRVGSFQALEKMGYQHFTISYKDRIFSFFVNKRITAEFKKNLTEQGLKYIGSETIHYSVNPELTKKYLPAAKEMLNDL